MNEENGQFQSIQYGRRNEKDNYLKKKGFSCLTADGLISKSVRSRCSGRKLYWNKRRKRMGGRVSISERRNGKEFEEITKIHSLQVKQEKH